MNEKIKKIANDFIELEKECQLGINISENMSKMENLIKCLSIKEMLEVNDLIEQNFLTK